MPLCIRTFDRSALSPDAKDGLTLEHIIPDALGGQWKTLTCKVCNNSHGSALDAHLVRMISAENWQDGDGSTLRGSVSIDGVNLPMKIAWGGDGKPNLITVPGAKAETLDDFQTRMRTLQEGDEVQLKLNFNYIPARVQRALVRIGYLAIFDHLGYEYVLSGAGTRVRRIFDGDHDDELWNLTPRVNVGDIQIKTPIIIAPLGQGAFVVAYLLLIRIEVRKRRHFAVLLPSSIIPEASVFPVLSEIRTTLQGQQLAIRVHEQGGESIL